MGVKMKNADTKIVIVVIGVLVLYLANLFLVEGFLFEKGLTIPMESVNYENIKIRALGDIAGMCVIPVIIVALCWRRLSVLRLSLASLKICSVLIFSLLIFWFLHADYSIRGTYKILFYTFLIGFCEEFIFRGYAYNLLAPIHRKGAILISGAFFGMGHAVLPIVHGQLPLEKAVIAILSTIGGGIVAGYFFIYLEERSRTLLVPILIHAILDYSYKWYGLAITICVWAYFFASHKREAVNCSVISGRE